MKFRKKPVVIEAVQITDAMFDAPHPNPEHVPGFIYDPIARCVHVRTLEGVMVGYIGDWIVTGVSGEKYPIKDEIFRLTYEPLGETDASEKLKVAVGLEDIQAIFDGWLADLRVKTCNCHGTSRMCKTCEDDLAVAQLAAARRVVQTMMTYARAARA